MSGERAARSVAGRPDPAPAARARLFVALDPTEAARAELAAWRDDATRDRSDLRPIPTEALHVTLAFLGWRALDEIEPARAAARVAAAGLPAPELRATAVVPVPRRAARLFALDLADSGGRAAAIQASVSAALERAGLYEPEQRQFWPHMTFARVRRGERPRALPAAAPANTFLAPRVTLYRSHLSPRGARYEALEQLDLGVSGGEPPPSG